MLTLFSLALTAELIGERAQSAPFIYGVMSLLEKLANGGMVVLIQSLIPCLKVSWQIKEWSSSSRASFLA